MADILVTGAFGGMGRATARRLAELGFRVFAMDRVVQTQAAAGGEEEPCDKPLSGDGGTPQRGEIVPIQADLTDEESVKTAFLRVQEMTDHLVGVVHFAGIYLLDSLVEMESADFERIFKVNVGGVYLVNRIFLPLLGRGGRIVITTSELAPLDPLPFTGIYAVTKAALDKYAYSLRMELQLKGIHVSVLRAGAVDTGMLGVSCAALDRFCEKTKLYSCNAARFKAVVDRVEARCVPPTKIAGKVARILSRRSPRFAYSINRNPLLLLLNALPKRMQCWAIRQVLKNKRSDKV